MSRVLVTGASGFVGRLLVPALLHAGHDVRAMTRHPESYDGPGEPVRGDVTDEESLAAATRGCNAAYYLVHSLEDSAFADHEARDAARFGRAAGAAGVEQVIYLGGLADPDADLSPHLRSRLDVETHLAAGGVPVTALRASMVVGAGSASWAVLRALTSRFAVLVGWPALRCRVQPVAARDVVRDLLDVLGRADCLDQVLEVGGPDVLTYAQMIDTVSRLDGGRPLPLFESPFLPRRLAAPVVARLAGLDATLVASLMESLGHEMVVGDQPIERVLPRRRIDFADAVIRALDDEAALAGR